MEVCEDKQKDIGWQLNKQSSLYLYWQPRTYALFNIHCLYTIWLSIDYTKHYRYCCRCRKETCIRTGSIFSCFPKVIYNSDNTLGTLYMYMHVDRTDSRRSNYSWWLPNLREFKWIFWQVLSYCIRFPVLANFIGRCKIWGLHQDKILLFCNAMRV